MKYFVLLSGFLLSVFSSCSILEEANDSPVEPALPFKPVNIVEHTKYEGYSVYMKTCYQCHEQADPATLSVDTWKNTVPAMAAHAGISEKDGQKVLEYILGVKSEGVR